MAALADSQPYCVVCSSDDVELVNDAPGLALPDENTEELSAVVCPECATKNIVSDVQLASLDNHMHCITCGISLDATTAGDDAGPGDEAKEKLEPHDDAEAKKTTGDSDDLTEVDPLKETAIKYSGVVGDGDLSPTQNAGDIATTVQRDDGDQELNDRVNEVTFTRKGGAVDVGDNDDMLVNMDQIVGDDDTSDLPDEFTVSLDSDNQVISANLHGIPVARLTKADAGANSEIFSKRSFKAAIIATAGQSGMDGLRELGFKPIRVALPIAAIVQARVDKELAAQRAVETASVDTLQDDYRQALAIAAAGLNKNFFTGYANTLKSAMQAELVAANVHSPSKVVERVFARNGEAFVATLLELAESIRQRPLEVRNELASALDQVNTVTLDPNAGDEDGDGSEDFDNSPEAVAARLGEHMGITTQRTAQVASVQQSTARSVNPGSIRSIAGGRSLFSRTS
jgi:hypothetical protein